MAWMPGPVRPCPAGVTAVQADPLGELHTTTSWWPGVAPNVPVAQNPPPAAVSAVTEARPSGTGRTASVQVAPPSDELAANGSCRPSVVSAEPTATTAAPLLATWVSAARAAPTGSGTFCWVQVRPPSAEAQAAGASPSEPTAMNPRRTAVTARICRWPPARPGRLLPRSAETASPARCQPVSPVDHQAAATVRPAMTW